ncbi:hypothetical protein CKO31_12330 [Thiohalocapsa halophila]|uniref:Uncharacterized protein n=1 Tax=Thiohalocapsa halophila TaxID=69359 RepID=A0ABS1CHW8_9GAMM|nr:hypothetical protein [Thiohalocapsa halophila]
MLRLATAAALLLAGACAVAQTADRIWSGGPILTGQRRLGGVRVRSLPGHVGCHGRGAGISVIAPAASFVATLVGQDPSVSAGPPSSGARSCIPAPAATFTTALKALIWLRSSRPQ